MTAKKALADICKKVAAENVHTEHVKDIELCAASFQFPRKAVTFLILKPLPDIRSEHHPAGDFSGKHFEYSFP